ncbi:protein disulfide-isomerase A2 [Clinocottus analis]|uniref:protein disulfide-isomerase A2 n=1 Tax=Clinocottus analis TaxID=304258 RepID=UPI0035BFB0EE
MRTHALFAVALLGLLLWASRGQADDVDAHPEDAQEDRSEETAEEETPGEAEEDTAEEPQKEKTTEIEEEDNVMVLHNVNFDRALSENQYLLVKFYVTWCGHCKKLAPVFAEVAGKLKEEGAAMRLAKVEATQETELSTEFNIMGFPILKLFTHGDRKNPIDYTGQRTPEGMIQWIKRAAGPGTPVLDSADSAAQFIDSHNITVIGFFDDPESEAVKVFNKLFLTLSDTELALTTSPKVFQKYKVKANSVVLFKKFDEGRADFSLSEEGELNPKNLTLFIKQNSLELIVPFHPDNAEKIFSAGINLHSLLIFNSSVEGQTALVDKSRSVAKEFKGKIIFVLIDIAEEGIAKVLDFFGVPKNELPTVRLMNMDNGKKFSPGDGDITTNSLRELCQGVVDGTAEAYFRSQEIPEDWHKAPVKVLVGKNFKIVALAKTKSVFVEFYAPWCKHCQELTPIWEQLAEKYIDREDIVIAKMDGTANEVESLTFSGFPTLKYYPAHSKKVVDYTGKRDLESLSKFLDSGGVLPEPEEVDEGGGDEERDEKGVNELGKNGFETVDEDVAEAEEVPTNTTSRDEL